MIVRSVVPVNRRKKERKGRKEKEKRNEMKNK